MIERSPEQKSPPPTILEARLGSSAICFDESRLSFEHDWPYFPKHSVPLSLLSPSLTTETCKVEVWAEVDAVDTNPADELFLNGRIISPSSPMKDRNQPSSSTRMLGYSLGAIAHGRKSLGAIAGNNINHLALSVYGNPASFEQVHQDWPMRIAIGRHMFSISAEQTDDVLMTEIKNYEIGPGKRRTVRRAPDGPEYFTDQDFDANLIEFFTALMLVRGYINGQTISANTIPHLSAPPDRWPLFAVIAARKKQRNSQILSTVPGFIAPADVLTFHYDGLPEAEDRRNQITAYMDEERHRHERIAQEERERQAREQIQRAQIVPKITQPKPSTSLPTEATTSDADQQRAWLQRINTPPGSLPDQRTATKPKTLEWSSDQYLADAVKRTLPKWTLDDIGGLEDIKEEIQDIALLYNNPDAASEWGVGQPAGILFYGEPGTGKTMLAHALAERTNSELWEVDSAKLYDMWLSLSSKNAGLLFDNIERHRGRLAVFFDELDAILSIGDSRGPGGATSERNQVTGIFKTRLNSLFESKKDLLLIAATNVLDRLDPAIIRDGRFDYKIAVPRPDGIGRTQIITILATKLILLGKANQDTFNVLSLSKLTDGFTGATLANIFKRVQRRMAITQARTGVPQLITQQDITDEIIRYRTFGSTSQNS